MTNWDWAIVVLAIWVIAVILLIAFFKGLGPDDDRS
jgi:hypothetical protein